MIPALADRIIEVRFIRGPNRRFAVSRGAIRKAGYPDVPTYLRATGQVDGWCEEIPREELHLYLTAEALRVECVRRAGERWIKTQPTQG